MTDLNRARERGTILRNARDRVAAVRAAREELARRRADLPEAACSLCGVLVPAGEGVRAPENAARVHPVAWDRVRGLVEMPEVLPAALDGWRRRHSTCATMSEGDLVHALTGVKLTEAQARDLRILWPSMLAANRVHRIVETPFAFLDDADLDNLRREAKRALARGRARRCRQGACALCGVAKSLAWVRVRGLWPDGEDGAVCSACTPLWRQCGMPTEERELGRLTLALVTGWLQPLGYDAPAGVRPYARSTGATREGTALPWSWAPERIADLRREVWTAHPEQAPEEYRDAAEGWHRELLATEREARNAERAAETADAW